MKSSLVFFILVIAVLDLGHALMRAPPNIECLLDSKNSSSNEPRMPIISVDPTPSIPTPVNKSAVDTANGYKLEDLAQTLSSVLRNYENDKWDKETSKRRCQQDIVTFLEFLLKKNSSIEDLLAGFVKENTNQQDNIIDEEIKFDLQKLVDLYPIKVFNFLKENNLNETLPQGNNNQKPKEPEDDENEGDDDEEHEGCKRRKNKHHKRPHHKRPHHGDRKHRKPHHENNEITINIETDDEGRHRNPFQNFFNHKRRKEHREDETFDIEVKIHKKDKHNRKHRPEFQIPRPDIEGERPPQLAIDDFGTMQWPQSRPQFMSEKPDFDMRPSNDDFNNDDDDDEEDDDENNDNNDEKPDFGKPRFPRKPEHSRPRPRPRPQFANNDDDDEEDDEDDDENDNNDEKPDLGRPRPFGDSKPDFGKPRFPRKPEDSRPRPRPQFANNDFNNDDEEDDEDDDENDNDEKPDFERPRPFGGSKPDFGKPRFPRKPENSRPRPRPQFANNDFNDDDEEDDDDKPEDFQGNPDFGFNNRPDFSEKPGFDNGPWGSDFGKPRFPRKPENSRPRPRPQFANNDFNDDDEEDDDDKPEDFQGNPDFGFNNRPDFSQKPGFDNGPWSPEDQPRPNILSRRPDDKPDFSGRPDGGEFRPRPSFGGKPQFSMSQFDDKPDFGGRPDFGGKPDGEEFRPRPSFGGRPQFGSDRPEFPMGHFGESKPHHGSGPRGHKNKRPNRDSRKHKRHHKQNNPEIQLYLDIEGK